MAATILRRNKARLHFLQMLIIMMITVHVACYTCPEVQREHLCADESPSQ